MSHPSYYYIKHLLIQSEGEEELDDLNVTLKLYGLPTLDEDEYSQIASNIEYPEEFDLEQKDSDVMREFMESEGVLSLWLGQEEDLSCIKIINQPRVKETIQILLLGEISSTEVSKRVEVKHRKNYSEQTISAFRHYFWNVDLFSGAELQAFTKDHPLQDSFLAAMYGSRNQALYRAGFNPVVDIRKALKEAHRSLVMRLEATRILPDNTNTAKTLALLTRELVGVHEALQSEGAGVEEMMKDLQKFVMQRNAPNVVSIHSVAPKNNFSQGGAKDEAK